jgi:hypothetical protein
VIRGAAVVVLAALATAWISYIHYWQHGGTRTLDYRLETMPHFESAKPFYSVTVSGKNEKVLITTGPRSSTGSAIQVVRAELQRSRVYIVVREVTKPGRAKITYPYRLLVFPDTHKPIHIHWQGRT